MARNDKKEFNEILKKNKLTIGAAVLILIITVTSNMLHAWFQLWPTISILILATFMVFVPFEPYIKKREPLKKAIVGSLIVLLAVLALFLFLIK